MKTIGLLGGTGWSSTIGYYKILNELVNDRLGGYHSAKVLLKSIDYHDIMTNYGKNHETVAQLLEKELNELFSLSPDSVMICCNSLHKYYDMIKNKLNFAIPVFHAIDLVAKHINERGYRKVLLLATKFTMEDGFFSNRLNQSDIVVTIPEQSEREEINVIHAQLMQNIVTEDSRNYFKNLILKYKDLDAIVLGCTEFPLVVTQNDSFLPIIDPMYLQAMAAVNYSLES